jgi:hypothetical protein
MPYLNWKTQSVELEVVSHEQRGSQLTMRLGRAAFDELLPRLEGVYIGGEGELRLDLPKDWIIFWKLRETESRLLIAHPQEKEWVTTVALDAPHGLKFMERLKALKPGESVALGELAPIGNVSNVEVVVQLS